VDHVLDILHSLRHSGVGILLIEQNLSVGIRAAETIAIMSAGQIVLVNETKAFASDEQLQHRYLGVATD